MTLTIINRLELSCLEIKIIWHYSDIRGQDGATEAHLGHPTVCRVKKRVNPCEMWQGINAVLSISVLVLRRGWCLLCVTALSSLTSLIQDQPKTKLTKATVTKSLPEKKNTCWSDGVANYKPASQSPWPDCCCCHRRIMISQQHLKIDVTIKRESVPHDSSTTDSPLRHWVIVMLWCWC